MFISLRIFLTTCLIFLLLSAIQQIVGQSIKFKNLTAEEGLSNNIVREVIQDKTGFLWFGTEDGLNRYDGYQFKIFRNDPKNSNSISDNSIWTLAEDKSGNIWIGTKAGILDRYDPLSEIITHWKFNSDITEENSITAFCEDSKGYIWIGTYKGGLYKLDLSTNHIINWNSNPENEKSLSHNYVQDIIEDSDGNILVATYVGLNRFDPLKPEEGFERFYHERDNPNTLSGNLIWRLIQSEISPDIIWVCTFNNINRFNIKESTFEQVEIKNPKNLQYGKSVNSVIEEYKDGEEIIWLASYSGLVKLNLKTGETHRFVKNEEDDKSLISNKINKIIRDRAGIIWLATENEISYISPKYSLFNSVDFGTSDSNISLLFNKKNITAIEKSGEDKVWIGTENGLYLIDDFKSYPKVKRIPALDGNHIWSLESDENNKLWIGTFGQGLKKYNYSANTVINWDIKDPKIQTQSVYYNKSLLKDSDNNIWIGYWGIGLTRLNPETGKINVWMHQRNDPNSLTHNDVWTLKQDRFGRIWLGTVGGGLNLFEDKNNGIFHHWLKNDKNGLSSNNIYSICVAENSKELNASTIILWIGTSDGLNRFKVINNNTDVYNLKTENEVFTIENGLQDNSVNSITEDEKGNLWIGTSSGISFFDVEKQKFTNFSSEDGINGTLMNTEASVKMKSGIILMGSSGGLNIFDPKKIKPSSFKPNIVITDFQIFNQSVEIGKETPLKRSLIAVEEIELSHNQDVFSIEFAALDFNSPKSIKYAHKMEGFDDDWIESGNRRFVTYTNLDPGRYLFKVKSTNADGVWTDNVKFLSIIINPPWWRTIWAYLLYVVLIVFGIIGIRRFEINRIKLRNELKLREVEVKQKTELEEIKSRFYANLSHEFRTPLMLIKGPLEQLKSETNNNKAKQNIELIERNSEKLKGLIDQLLELSQVEKSAVNLKAKKTELISLLKGMVSSFNSLAEQKNINLKFQTKQNEIVCWVDVDKFEKIINNLLLNALKFTAKGGRVAVAIEEKMTNGTPAAEIKISDTGISIPKEKLNKIFDRYFQVEDSTQRLHGGSGIGLSLVKEFVELHKWDISVESEQGRGTTFIINIPLNDDYLEPYEKIEKETDEVIKQTESDTQQEVAADFSKKREMVSTNTTDQFSSDKKPNILIVDDSEDVRTYLINLLENEFNISEAANGEEGIRVAIEILPDLIISDIMMPSMDGLEFCSRVKSQWQTSDIPVILLTAKAGIESKLEGLETGADDYLTKPFESRELLIRINNLLEQRRKLKEKYSQSLDPLSDIKNLNTTDAEFVEKVLELIDANIDKANFNTEKLASLLFMSRTTLHRKLISITGQAPGDLIRTIKLNRAAKYLLEGKLSVTQIAYEIGFSSPAQFSRAFLKQFNCPPSEYTSRRKT